MAVHFSKSRRGDPRLIGTWQADADATIAEFRKSPHFTAELEEAWRKIFGKLKVTYTDSTVTMDFDARIDTQPYEVVSKDGDLVVIKGLSALTQQDEQSRIRFIDADTYCVEAPPGALIQFKEVFRRIK